MAPVVSPHALSRFRERADHEAASDRDLLAALAAADPAEDWVCDAFAGYSSSIPGSEYWQGGGLVFVLIPLAVVAWGKSISPPYRVATVLLEEWAEDRQEDDDWRY